MAGRRWPRWLLRAAVGLLCSCSGSTDSLTAPLEEDLTPASISISEPAITVEVNFTEPLAATVRARNGTVLDGVAVSWSSSNTSVAQIFGAYLEGVSAGSAIVTASAGQLTATVPVTVIPTAVAAVTLSRAAAILAPGRTLQLIATPRDRFNRPIPGRNAGLSSSNDAVAEVTQDGLVSAGSPGAATITASLDGKSDTTGISVVVPSVLLIPVTAAAPSLGPPPVAYTVSLGHPDDSLTLANSWGATGQLDGVITLAPELEIRARAPSDPGNDHWPLAAVISRQANHASINLIFVPAGVTLSSGTFAGGFVFTGMAGAFASCWLPDNNQCRHGFYPSSFSVGVERWAAYPVPVWLDAGIDSALVWSALHAMEAAAGMQLFTSVGDGPGIRVSPGLPPGVTGFAGYAQWNWDATDQITGARVWFAGTPSRRLVQHEFTHALGFAHTCSWPSVMGGYGCPQAEEVTKEDIAHILLASSVFEAERAVRFSDGSLPCATLSFGAALQFSPQRLLCPGGGFVFSRETPSGIPDEDPASVRSRSMP